MGVFFTTVKLLLFTLVALITIVMVVDPLADVSDSRPYSLADGYQMYASVYGEEKSPRCLIYHPGAGWCGAMHDLSWDAELKQQNIRLVLPERPGCGHSRVNSSRPATLMQHGSDMIELADLLGCEKIAAAGWSSGGPFVLAHALQSSKRGRPLRSVIVIAGDPPLDRRRLSGKEADEMIPGDVQMLVNLLTGNWSFFMRFLLRVGEWFQYFNFGELFFRALAGPLVGSEEEFLHVLAVTNMRGHAHCPNVFECMRQDFISETNWTFDPKALEVLCGDETKIHIFHGTKDVANPFSVALYFQAIMPCAEVRAYEGWGHMIGVHPEALNHLLQAAKF